MSLDLEGRLKIDDHNRYASLTQYNEKFNYTNVLVDVVPFDSNKISGLKMKVSIRLYW